MIYKPRIESPSAEGSNGMNRRDFLSKVGLIIAGATADGTPIAQVLENFHGRFSKTEVSPETINQARTIISNIFAVFNSDNYQQSERVLLHKFYSVNDVPQYDFKIIDLGIGLQLQFSNQTDYSRVTLQQLNLFLDADGGIRLTYSRNADNLSEGLYLNLLNPQDVAALNSNSLEDNFLHDLRVNLQELSGLGLSGAQLDELVRGHARSIGVDTFDGARILTNAQRERIEAHNNLYDLAVSLGLPIYEFSTIGGTEGTKAFEIDENTGIAIVPKLETEGEFSLMVIHRDHTGATNGSAVELFVDESNQLSLAYLEGWRYTTSSGNFVIAYETRETSAMLSEALNQLRGGTSQTLSTFLDKNPVKLMPADYVPARKLIIRVPEQSGLGVLQVVPDFEAGDLSFINNIVQEAPYFNLGNVIQVRFEPREQ